MTKDVIIYLRSIHMDPFGHEDSQVIENTYRGNYFYKNNKHFCLYDEFLDEDNKPTRNQIKISERSAEVLKKGQVIAKMEFDLDSRTLSRYDTPYGPLDISIETEKISILEKEDRLLTEFEYDIYIGEEKNSHCIMTLDIRSDV